VQSARSDLERIHTIGGDFLWPAWSLQKRLRWTKWLVDSYIIGMSTHSVAEAKNKLSKLIDRALKGENVVITRHGHPVVEMQPVTRPARRMTEADLEWLKSRREGRPSLGKDAATIVREMRDED
jgi:prevent-host-death family protein